MIIKLNTSCSRRHKKGKRHKDSDRSKYLKMLFNIMKGDLGDGLINSYTTGDADKFLEHWARLTKAVEEEVSKGKKQSEEEKDSGKE